MSSTKTAPSQTPNNPSAAKSKEKATPRTPEIKRAKFKELAEKRVTRAIKVIGHVGNLSSKSSYEYTPEQAQKIVNAIGRAFDVMAKRFSGQSQPESTFTL